MSASYWRFVGFLGLVVLISADPVSSAEDKVNVPALIKQLDDKDEQVRLVAAKQLGKQGANATEAVPALTKLLNDPSVSLRLVASQALQSIQAAGSSASTQSKSVADDRDKKLKELKTKLEVAKLIDRLDDPDEVVRLLAARELGKRGADAKDAVSALTKALSDTDVDVRHVASQSLNTIQVSLDKTKADADQKKALADLQKKLDDAGKTKGTATDLDKARETIDQKDRQIAELNKKSALSRAEMEKEIVKLKETVQELNKKLKKK